MSYNELSEAQAQNLLEAITNTVIAGQSELEPIVRRYDVNQADIDPYVQLIQSIHATLNPSLPDETFVANLKADLIGSPQQIGLSRFPMRARMAAAVAALLAALLLVLRRRHSDEGLAEALDLPALQG